MSSPETPSNPARRSFLREAAIASGLTVGAMGVSIITTGIVAEEIDAVQCKEPLLSPFVVIQERVKRLFKIPAAVSLTETDLVAPTPPQKREEAGPVGRANPEQRVIRNEHVVLPPITSKIFPITSTIEWKLSLEPLIVKSNRAIGEKYQGNTTALASDIVRVHMFSALAQEVAQIYGFDDDFFGVTVAPGMMLWESRGDKDDPHGGLFQIEQIALDHVNQRLAAQGKATISFSQLGDPAINILVAFEYLQAQYDRFGDISYAVFAFHNGMDATQTAIRNALQERGVSSREMERVLGSTENYAQLITQYHITLPSVTTARLVREQFSDKPSQSLEYTYLVAACGDVIAKSMD